MNIFHKIALQSLKKNRTRTLVTIFGVILSAVMITGVTIFGVSLLDYMGRSAVKKYGSWNAAFLNVNGSFIQERMLDEEVSGSVTFENIGYARLEGGSNMDKPYLFVTGFSQETFEALPTSLITGRLPENSSEVLVSARLLTDGGVSYNVGDTISLSVGSRINGEEELTQAAPYNAEEESFVPREEKTYTIVGTCRTPVFETDEAPGYTLITISDTADTSGSYSLFVTLKSPRKVYSYAENAKNGHAYILNYDVLRNMGLSNKPADKVLMAFLYSFGGIVLAIIMVGSIFLIYNSFQISLSERIREIGVLASVGATSRQLQGSVLFEGICIGIVGIPIGIFIGLGSIKAVISAVSNNFAVILNSGVPLMMKVSMPVIAGSAVISLITILISAWLPARKAVHMPVMECIRQTNEIKVNAKSLKISRRKQHMYGLEGTLALKNFKRNKKRYRSIVLSLVLSIVLFVSTNALISSLQQTADGFKIVSDYDIGFGTQDMEDSDLIQLYDKLKNAEGVQKSSYRAAIRYSCTVPADCLSDAYWEITEKHSGEEAHTLPMEIHFFDDEFYRQMVWDFGLPPEEYTGQNGKLPAVAKINSDDAEGVTDLADIFADASIDCTLTPQMSNGTDAPQGQTLTITPLEIVPPDIPPVLAGNDEQESLPYDFEILAPWSAKELLAPSALPLDLRVKGLCFDSETPSQSEREMRDIVTSEGIASSYLLLNSADAFEQYRNYIFIANIFAYIFIVLISLIAAANVFNTISTNIRLRRRELAMLRSVGMSDKDFNKMMRFECVFYGTKALLIGIPLSLITSVLIIKTMMVDDTTLILPWASVGISVLSVFLIIFITMMYAVSKIKKENIIDALRDEMT